LLTHLADRFDYSPALEALETASHDAAEPAPVH
jgi:hypothetical protein